MTRAIDHFMYVGTDLAALSAWFQHLSGAPASPGGQHLGVGTHNALVGGDKACYLELLAPDPTSTVESAWRSGIEAVARPQLHRIILKAAQADFPTIIAAYARAGIHAQAHAFERRTTTGELLQWQLLIPAADHEGVFAPLFIDWLDTPHPTTRLSPDLRFLNCTAGHPEAARIAVLWQDLGVGIPLHSADAPYVHVRLGTPRGDVVLTTS